MNKSENKRPAVYSKPDSSAATVADIAIARMKSGAVVREERVKRAKFSLYIAIAISLIAFFSVYDFVFQTPDSATDANGDVVVTLSQGPQGHYNVAGNINGQSVKFVVDTGATDIAIPMSVAEKLGLPLGRRINTITANGYGVAYETTISSIELGGIKMNGVSASVTEGLVGDTALLGMSFLSRTKVMQENGVMTITF